MNFVTMVLNTAYWGIPWEFPNTNRPGVEQILKFATVFLLGSVPDLGELTSSYNSPSDRTVLTLYRFFTVVMIALHVQYN